MLLISIYAMKEAGYRIKRRREHFHTVYVERVPVPDYAFSIFNFQSVLAVRILSPVGQRQKLTT